MALLRTQRRRIFSHAALFFLAVVLILCEAASHEKNDPRQALSRARYFQRLQGEVNLRIARALYQKALPLGHASLDIDTQVSAWIDLGRVESLLGDIEAEITAYGNALKLIRRIEKSPREASILNDLGRALRMAGHLDRARDTYRSALSLAEKSGQTNEEAAALNNLGMLEHISGDEEAAITLYERALARWRAATDENGAAITLSNLGEAYVLLGRPEDAIDFFRRALEVLERNGRDKSAAATWMMMGWAKFALGDREGALQAYRTAMELQEKVGDVTGKAATLDRLGTGYREMQRFADSLNAYREALQIIERSGSVYSAVNIHFNLCNLFLDWNRLAAAEQECSRAQSLLPGVNDPNAAAHGWFLAARISYKRGQFARARENVEKAIALVDGLWREPSSRPLRASFIAARRSYFDFYLDLLFELHGRNPRAGWDQRAFELSERIRTRGLVDALLSAQERTTDDRGLNSDLIDRERYIRSRIETLLSQATNGVAEDPALDSRLRSLRRRRDEIQAQITRSEGTSALLLRGPVGLKEAQLATTNGSTVLLAFAVSERSSMLWLVTANGIESHFLPGRKALADSVEALQLLLEKLPQRSEETQTRLILQRASDQVLGPIIGRLRSERLIVIPDGPLQFLPFAALPVPSPGASATEPLIARHEIVYLPSVSALIANSKLRIRNRRRFAKEILVAADPVFTATDDRVRSSLLKTSPYGGLAAGSNGEASWKRLPGTRREALRIFDLLGPNRATLLLDFEASRDRVLQELPGHRIIHLATHGQFNSRFPELSGIVLSLTDPQGSTRSGFLRVQDLYGLHLTADLVVLSGCRTARGVELYSEGLVGFSQALMVAGARQLVANLWDADDDSTAELMVNFYHRMLGDGLSPAAALREAQLSLLRTKRWSPPYYWAGFRLQGDWR